MTLILCCLIFCTFLRTYSETINCEGISDCYCTNDNESCVLKCGIWKACYATEANPITLSCTPGQPCHIDCDGGDMSCFGITINGNGATSLTVTCTNWKDCESATVNCDTASTCNVICRHDMNVGTIDQCEKLTLNCGISACSIHCDGDATVNNGGCTGIKVPNSIRPFSYECIGDEAASCIDSPERVLPPTYDPTSDPTMEPTLPTLSPSQTPTVPTQNPSVSPTLAPTVPLETVSNITIEIVVTDGEVTEDEILDTIANTTDKYLNTLFAEEDDYELIVSVIRLDGDVLVVNIVVAVPKGDTVSFINEQEVIEENENGINAQFGEKLIVRNPYSIASDDILFAEQWYFYAIIAVLLLVIIALTMYLFIKRKKAKQFETNDETLRDNEMMTPTAGKETDNLKKVKSHSTADDGHSDDDSDVKITAGDRNVDELYAVSADGADDEKVMEHVTINEEEDEIYGKGQDEFEETPRMTAGNTLE